MKLIILDRDGVINEDSDDYIKTPDEWQPIDGSLDAIARLSHAGYRVIVASNQSGISRGLFTIEDLNNIHEKMHNMVKGAGGTIDAVFYSPYGPDDNAYCRKPNPGMLEDISSRLRVGLKGVPMVGDKLSDIEAALKAGAQPILVRTGKGSETEAEAGNLRNVPVHDSLLSYVDNLIGNE